MKQTIKQRTKLRNFVAKNAHKVNKSVVHRDRTKYTRKKRFNHLNE